MKSSIYSTNINASTKIVSLAVNDYVSCPVSYVPQGNDNICWAASDACIGNYLKGLNRSAVYVAQCYFTPPADYNQGLSDGGLITTILNSVFNLSYTYHAWVTPSIYTSKSIISSGKPILAFLQFGAAHHVGVIYGVSTTGNYFHIMDPTCGFVSGDWDGSTYHYFQPITGNSYDLIHYSA